MSKPKYYLTTPVYDAASGPQIGSLYTAILCDAIARHKRMCGFEVAHFMGADTHGEDVEKPFESGGSARGASLQQNYNKYEELLNLVDVHGTHFQRTFSAEHILAIETLLRRALRHARRAIYKSRYEGRFCLHDQIDVSDSAEPANCEVCGRTATLISEDRHFFRLSSFRDRLIALYRDSPDFVQPRSRLDEIRSFTAKGLKDIPISRKSAGHGIPWPDDPDQIVSGRYAELVTYLSGVGFGGTGDSSDEFRKYWPADLHVISSEALWAHAIFWPALLMAADLPSPRHIFAHGAVSLEEEDKDKSFFSEPVLNALGSDPVRYYLLREVGYGENTQVGTGRLVQRCSVDLAEGLANLANRVHGMLARQCKGKIPARSLFSSVDPVIEILSADIRAEVRISLDRFDFSKGLEKIWALIAAIDKLLKDNARFEHADNPSDKQRFTDVIHDASEGLALVALLLHPILPRATDAIWKSLGRPARLEDQLVDETPWSSLMPGSSIGNLEILFPGLGNLQRAASAKPESSPNGLQDILRRFRTHAK
jgi:methionyl-tRNA synthetase